MEPRARWMDSSASAAWRASERSRDTQRRGQVENEGFKVNSGREFFEVAASRKERTIAGHNHGAEVSGAVETLNDLKQFFTSLPTGALAFSGHRDPLQRGLNATNVLSVCPVEQFAERSLTVTPVRNRRSKRNSHTRRVRRRDCGSCPVFCLVQ